MASTNSTGKHIISVLATETLRPEETAGLGGGQRKKRKCNEKEALALKAPSRQLIPTSTTTIVYVAEQKMTGQKMTGQKQPGADPIAMFGDDVCMKIVEFLCHNAHDGQSSNTAITSFSKVHQIGSTHATLRAVSPLWKATFDRTPWGKQAGLAELCLKKSSHQRSMKGWLCRYNIRIGALNVDCQEPNKLELLSSVIQLVLKDCNTQDVKRVRIEADPIQSICRAPFGRKLKRLHDAIAMNCPKLEDLATMVVIPKTNPIYSSEYVSSRLFSMRSIKSLGITLAFCNDGKAVDPKWETNTPIDCEGFSKFIQNLPNLDKLRLGPAHQQEIKQRQFLVESNTITELVVEDEGMHLCFFCPRLQHLKYNAGRRGMCLLPPLGPNEYASLFQQPVGEVSIPGASCLGRHGYRGGAGWRAHLIDFHSWDPGHYSGYMMEYAARWSAREEATFETFNQGGRVDTAITHA